MEGTKFENNLLNIYTKSGGDIFYMAELMGQEIDDFIKFVKHYPNFWKKIKDDMSGYITPNYGVKTYKIPFNIVNIWINEDGDIIYTDYKIDLILPNIDKLTEKEKEDFIGQFIMIVMIWVLISHLTMTYMTIDMRNTVLVDSINGEQLSKEKIKEILGTHDFITNETIEKLMKKMNGMNENKKHPEEFNGKNFNVQVINKGLKRIKFHEFVSDVKFEGVGEDYGHPVFYIRFTIDYLGEYKKNLGKPIDTADILYDTLDKVNTLIQLIDNPHDKGIWYQIYYKVYSLGFPENEPLMLKKSYFLS